MVKVYTVAMDPPEIPISAAEAKLKPQAAPARRIDTGPLTLPTSSRFAADLETQRYLQTLFQTDFDNFEGFLSPSNPVGKTFTGMMEELMKRTVAEEFQRPNSYTPPGEAKETLTAEPVLMFRRAAFMHNIMQKAGYDASSGQFAQSPAFVSLDLKDLFSANMAGAGDWMLSSVARCINDTTRVYFERIGKGAQYATCRYGGDEFVVGTVGLTQEENRQLQEELGSEINKLEGYYGNAATGKIEKRNIELNKDKDEIITIPQDQTERDIFITYLRRGLILDGEQIEKVKTLFTRKGVFQRANFFTTTTRQDVPQGINSKVAAILFGDPDLSTVMTLADYIDRKEIDAAASGGTTEAGAAGKRKRNLVNLLEGVVYDGLLGENVLSTEGMISQIRKGSVASVACFDLKFIKEINDTASYAEGDMAIETLWERMISTMGVNEKRALIFARRGGTFLVGLRKGAKDNGQLKAMQQVLKKIYIGVRGRQANIPIGMSYLNLKGDGKDMDRDEIRLTMGQLFQDAESDWYKKAVSTAQGNATLRGYFSELNERIKKGDSAEEVADEIRARIAQSPFEGLLDDLTARFFFGKPGLRRELRLNRILHELY